MELFFKTLIAGIKEGSMAAWETWKWYILVVAIGLAVYLTVLKVKDLFRQMRK
jgi:uncharacterized membrane protein YdbT with pleckstrin-like domain